jgi:hypothetical protein
VTEQQYPEWAAKRTRGNRIIGLVLFGLVLLLIFLFVVRFVVR